MGELVLGLGGLPKFLERGLLGDYDLLKIHRSSTPSLAPSVKKPGISEFEPIGVSSWALL